MEKPAYSDIMNRLEKIELELADHMQSIMFLYEVLIKDITNIRRELGEGG
jgi:flagellar motor switch protein FliG